MAADPIGDDNPIEAILLTAFPNPEREGCPDGEKIRKMAEQGVPRDDPMWSHLWNCSPCFRDFKALRDVRVARIERELHRRRSKRNVLIGALSVMLSSVLAYFGAVEFTSRPRRVVPITVDLTNAGAKRGAAVPTAHLPKKLDEIHLRLPSLSPPGPYVVAILESATNNNAVALTYANAVQSGDSLLLVATLDLAGVPTGQYLLGIRRDVGGHQQEPTLYPVLVSE